MNLRNLVIRLPAANFTLNPSGRAGFTLIEILVVIGMIALLAGVVIVAINPGRQFAQGRNTQRLSNVNAILNAIGQRMADNRGVFAGSFYTGAGTTTCPSLPSNSTAIKSSGGVDLSCLVPTYIPSQLPTDPDSGTGAKYHSLSDYDTQYEVLADTTSGRVTVSAPHAELNQGISITR